MLPLVLLIKLLLSFISKFLFWSVGYQLATFARILVAKYFFHSPWWPKWSQLGALLRVKVAICLVYEKLMICIHIWHQRTGHDMVNSWTKHLVSSLKQKIRKSTPNLIWTYFLDYLRVCLEVLDKNFTSARLKWGLGSTLVRYTCMREYL